MEKLKVLIADDSVVYRSQVRGALAELSWVEVIGAAANGKQALARLDLGPADLLILDVEMPEMDGLATLAELSKRPQPPKVIMFSSATKRGAEITLEALRSGASDFVTKPGGSAAELVGQGSPAALIRGLLEPRIRALFPFHAGAVPAAAPAAEPGAPAKYPAILWEVFRPRVILIGSSTGGPTVLESMFARIKGPLRCPILIAQHMPPVFTASLAERLARLSGLVVKEAAHGEPLLNGQVYVAPGDFHLTVTGSAAAPLLQLDKGPAENSVRPAVDPLFRTAAKLYGSGALGIILTGMGYDGKLGCEAVKAAGGAVVIQEEKSCVVFGMPGAVHAAGAYDRILVPNDIADLIAVKAGSGLAAA